MAHPEGYRKVKRLYELAGRFGLPIVVLVDTPGAFAGRGGEERGQAWAISADLMALARAPVPVISMIIGEEALGRSGDVRRGLRRDARGLIPLSRSARGVRIDHLPRFGPGRRGRRGCFKLNGKGSEAARNR